MRKRVMQYSAKQYMRPNRTRSQKKTQPKESQEDETVVEVEGGLRGASSGIHTWESCWHTSYEMNTPQMGDRSPDWSPRSSRNQTKGAIGIMLKKYREARCLYDRTGSGDIMETKVVNGKEVSVVKTLTEQYKDILSSAGLNRHGIKGSLVIGTGSQMESQLEEEETQVPKKPNDDDDVTQDEDDESGDDLDKHVGGEE
ncbi:hypothetical protein EV426DRAFT_645726 [Tirmania nivea]|nr:hypothetical protein EV426DRAFT_645726 [Tirmania nivea]